MRLCWFGTLLILALVSFASHATDPVCDGDWSKTSKVWTCNGQVTFVSGSSFVPAQTLTIKASHGFILQNNTVGSQSVSVNLQADFGPVTVGGNQSTLYGNLTGSGSHFTLNQLYAVGNINTNGTIKFTGGRVIGNITSNSHGVELTSTEVMGTLWSHANVVFNSATMTGFVTSNSGTITSSNSQITGDLTAQSGMSFNGGSLAGHLLQKAANGVSLSNIKMTSGSIKGASSVSLSGSTLGSSSQKVEVKTESGNITLTNKTVLYGDAIAVENAKWATVNIESGSMVYGRCHYEAVPPQACQPAPPPPSVHHYELSYQSPAVTCEAEAITVRACLNAACSSTYQGSSSVILSANNNASWSSSSLSLNQGSASTMLRKTSAGSTTISMASATPAASSVLQCKNAGQSSNCTLDFAEAALKIRAADGSSLWPHQTAGTSYSGRVRAIQTNPETGACQARVTGSRAVGLAFRCLDPNSCIATERGRFNNIDLAGSGNSPTYSAVNLTFDNQGSAPLTFQYSDVGQIALYAQLVLTEAAPQPAITLTATPATLVVKPDRLVVHAVTRSDGSANPGSTTSGTGFVAADSWFKVELEARNSLDQRTPNFGRESTPEKLRLIFGTRVYPTPQADIKFMDALMLLVNGDFLPVSGVGGRFVNSQVAFREVGTIQLQTKLVDGNYLGAGDVSTSPFSSNIGRFYPAHFQLSEVTSASLCAAGSFSYMQQPQVPIRFSLTAMSQGISQPGVQLSARQLLNYHQFTASGNTSYAGLAVPQLVAENLTPQQWAQLSSRFENAPAVLWQQGKAKFDGSSGLMFSRSTQPDGPFLAVQPGVKIVSEIDQRNLQASAFTMNAATSNDCKVAGSCDAAALGVPLKFYYGRLVLEPAQGPANRQIPLRVQAQHFDGVRFSTFSADQCTQVDPTLLKVAQMPNWKADGSVHSMQQGNSASNSLWLLPQAQTGRWTMQYPLPAWLKQGNSDATAPVVVGGYRGNDRLIYQREQ
jgi:MSHA biogenesis protein MshQ